MHDAPDDMAGEIPETLLWQWRDAAAVDELARRFLPLASVLAGRIGRGLDPDARQSAAHEALLEAIGKFDPERGIRFSTWLGNIVRGRVLDACRDANPLGRVTVARANRVETVRAAIAAQLGRLPTDEELVDAGVRDVDLAASRRRWPEPLQCAKPDEGRRAWSFNRDRHVEPAAPREDRELEDRVATACRGLSLQQQTIVYLHYVHGQTFKFIGQALHVSESRISQIHTQLVERLRTRGDFVKQSLTP